MKPTLNFVVVDEKHILLIIVFTTRYQIQPMLTSEVLKYRTDTETSRIFAKFRSLVACLSFSQILLSLLHKEKSSSEPSITQLTCYMFSLLFCSSICFIPSTSFDPTPHKSQLYPTGFTDYVVVGVHTYTT